MGKWFFDYDSGEMGFSMSGNMGMSSDGDMLIRMGENMVMNMDSGELEIISGWPEENSGGKSFDDDDD